VEQQKEFQKSLVAFTNLKKTDPEKVMHVEMLISTANKDPEIQKKVDEIRKFVHDYVAKQSPADLQTLEIMIKPKQILEHNGVPGNLVY
jgi:flagellar basal body-associated protein FliL